MILESSRVPEIIAVIKTHVGCKLVVRAAFYFIVSS